MRRARNLELRATADGMQSRNCMTDAARFTEDLPSAQFIDIPLCLSYERQHGYRGRGHAGNIPAIHCRPESFDSKRGALGAYLYGVARNLVRRHLEQGRKFLCVDDADECEYTVDQDLLGDLTRRESIEALQEAVLCLPPKYRETVVLCDLQELSYEAAAAAMECAVGTVRSRLHRARALLANKMQARCVV